jgi:orotate phosphoribosyltransferase
MTQDDVLKIFKDNNALLEGHFKLSSGLHSGQYLQCALLLQYPDMAARLCAGLAKEFKNKKVTAVIGPALGGVVVSYEVARSLGARSLFAERDAAGAMVLRRGFSIDKSDSVLLVEDVVTTGGSLLELVDIVKASGARLVGVAVLIDRSAGSASFGVPFTALAKIDIKAYSESDCPFCKQGVPIVKPGSKK